MPSDSSSEPLVSVVIPAYKVEHFIAQTLRSVYKQTVTDLEIIVVNDGSPDKTGEVLAQETDPRLRVIDQPNGGECVARNRGMAEARGKYIAFLDSDDAWLPDHLEWAVRFLEANPDIAWYSTRYTSVRQISDADLIPSSPCSSGFYAVNWYLEGNPITSSSTAVVRRSALPPGDLFPPGVKMFGDCVGWCRLARLHPMMGTMDRSTALYRIWEGSATKAYLRTGLGTSSGTEMDALLLWQEMYENPNYSAEAKLFVRGMSLGNWSMRLRSASLFHWLPEIQQRRPVTGSFLTAWLKLCVYVNHLHIRVMRKLVRICYQSIEREKAKLAAQVRRQLPGAEV